MWLWVATAVGFAQRRLTTLPKPIAALAEVSYPMYLTHWLWLIAAGATILPLALPVSAKIAGVLAVVYGGTFCTCRLLQHGRYGRLLFGMRAAEPRRAALPATGVGVAIPPGYHPGVPTVAGRFPLNGSPSRDGRKLHRRGRVRA